MDPMLERKVNELICMAGIQLENQEDLCAKSRNGKEDGIRVLLATDAKAFGEKNEAREGQ